MIMNNFNFIGFILTLLGIEFSEENRLLLKEFCEIGLTKDSLTNLWNNLCTAITTYHAKSTEYT